MSLTVLLLAACGVTKRDVSAKKATGVEGIETDETTGTTIAKTIEDPVRLEVTGMDESPLNLVATTAIADLEQWWTDQYPSFRSGGTYLPLSGGLFAYDSGTNPASLPCPTDDIAKAMFNAYYCPPADAVAWDQEELLPTVSKNFGDFTVAVIMAHEWGHVVQSSHRAGIEQASVVMELQADCLAGAWVSHVATDDPTPFAVDTKVLDMALAGILSLRDQPGATANDTSAHGSGFDRVSAFQDGYDSGVKSCSTYTNDTVRPYMFDWNCNANGVCDADNGGNMAFDDQGEEQGIITLSLASLEYWWTQTFPELAKGKAWKSMKPAVSFETSEPAECNGKPVEGYRLFYCSADRFVGYETNNLYEAYERNGDFGAATLLATQYGLAAQIDLGLDTKDDPISATLRGDCFAGAWGAALIADGNDKSDLLLELSPGDLDEGVQVLLSFRTDSDRQRQGPGFDRVRAFRIGVTQGAKACLNVKASTGN